MKKYRLSGFNLPFKVNTLLFNVVCHFSTLQMAIYKRLSTEVYLWALQWEHKDLDFDLQDNEMWVFLLQNHLMHF